MGGFLGGRLELDVGRRLKIVSRINKWWFSYRLIPFNYPEMGIHMANIRKKDTTNGPPNAKIPNKSRGCGGGAVYPRNDKDLFQGSA